jgi:hypothetical protein
VSQTAAFIAEQLQAWGYTPFVVRDVFGGATAEETAAALNEFCLRSLGSDIERSELFHASVAACTA